MSAMQGISPDGIQAYVASEKAQHSKDLYTSTFVPYLGMVLNGDHSNGYFGMQDAQMYYASQSVATLKMQGNISDIPYVASKDNPDGYKRQLYNVSRKPLLEFTTPLKRQLWDANRETQKRQAYMQSGGQIPYVASVPPGGNDSAAQVVGPLTQIPFIQDVLGFPTPEYHINELTTKVPLPQLHAEQPETDWGTPNLQLEPTQFVENRRPEFQSHFFLAKAQRVRLLYPERVQVPRHHRPVQHLRKAGIRRPQAGAGSPHPPGTQQAPGNHGYPRPDGKHHHIRIPGGAEQRESDIREHICRLLAVHQAPGRFHRDASRRFRRV